MAAMKFDTRLLEKIHRGADMWSFRFDKPGDYEYQAGQWATINLPRGGAPLSHHFSHSSSPTEPFLELTTRIRDSEFKQALAALEPGVEVEMEGPCGSFVLPEEIREVVFLTGGIGITPVRSIVRYLVDTGSERRVVVFYANRDEDNICFREELAQLEDQLPYLHFVYVLSDPKGPWQGYRGLVSAEILEAELEVLTGLSYYISGPPAMVDAMRSVLRKEWIATSSMVLENFVGYE